MRCRWRPATAITEPVIPTSNRLFMTQTSTRRTPTLYTTLFIPGDFDLSGGACATWMCVVRELVQFAMDGDARRYRWRKMLVAEVPVGLRRCFEVLVHTPRHRTWEQVNGSISVRTSASSGQSKPGLKQKLTDSFDVSAHALYRATPASHFHPHRRPITASKREHDTPHGPPQS